MVSSISLGVTNMLFSPGGTAFLSRTASYTIVAASTTVGTPMAITGTPMVSLVRLCLWFPTPEPGWMPASEI